MNPIGHGLRQDKMEDLIHRIRACVKGGDWRFTLHALERCIERGISPKEVEGAVLSGEVIEYYPYDKYGPTCLIRGLTFTGRILHVLCSVEPVWIITAYDPTLRPDEWDDEFKVRRKR